MRDARTPFVLLAAAVVVAALFAPWYAVDLSGPARDALAQGSERLPQTLGAFARGLLSVLPDRIVGNAWDVFEKSDVVLLCCALGAAFAALLERFDVAALAGGAAAATIVLAMVDKPGPGGEIVQMQWGPWLALAGAAAIVVAARVGAREPGDGASGNAEPTFPPPPAEKPVAASVWPPV